MLLTSQEPSSEHPKSRILVVGSIVFKHLFGLSGSTGKHPKADSGATPGLDLLRAWLHACSMPGPKRPQADSKSDFPKTKFQHTAFCKTVCALCKNDFKLNRPVRACACVLAVPAVSQLFDSPEARESHPKQIMEPRLAWICSAPGSVPAPSLLYAC